MTQDAPYLTDTWRPHCLECGRPCAEPCDRCDPPEVDEFGTMPMRLGSGALVIDGEGER